MGTATWIAAGRGLIEGIGAIRHYSGYMETVSELALRLERARLKHQVAVQARKVLRFEVERTVAKWENEKRLLNELRWGGRDGHFAGRWACRLGDCAFLKG